MGTPLHRGCLAAGPVQRNDAGTRSAGLLCSGVARTVIHDDDFADQRMADKRHHHPADRRGLVMGRHDCGDPCFWRRNHC